jgi:hypothetical protein
MVSMGVPSAAHTARDQIAEVCRCRGQEGPRAGRRWRADDGGRLFLGVLPLVVQLFVEAARASRARGPARGRRRACGERMTVSGVVPSAAHTARDQVAEVCRCRGQEGPRADDRRRLFVGVLPLVVQLFVEAARAPEGSIRRRWGRRSDAARWGRSR